MVEPFKFIGIMNKVWLKSTILPLLLYVFLLFFVSIYFFFHLLLDWIFFKIPFCIICLLVYFLYFFVLLSIFLLGGHIALGFIVYTLNYHRLPSSSSIPFHVHHKYTRLYINFPSPGLCAIIVIHFAFTFIIDSTINWYYFKRVKWSFNRT